MRKVFLVLLFVSIMSVSFFSKWGITVSDQEHSVELKEYKRIVSLSPAAVEIIYMLGGEANIAGIATTRSGIWPEEETSRLESVGSLTQPSLEKIISLDPDLVILNSMNTQFAEVLAQNGVEYLSYSSDYLEEVLLELPLFGILVGKQQEAIVLSAEKLKMLAEIRTALSENPLNLKGAFLYSASPMQGFNEQSLPGQILEILGCENIVTSQMAKPIVTPEYLVQQNPDFIFGAMAISKVEDIVDSNPLIYETKAGENNNIFLIPSYKILRPTPRVVDFIEELYEMLKNLN